MSFTSEPDSWRTPPSWVNTAGEVGVCMSRDEAMFPFSVVCKLKQAKSYKAVNASNIQ